MQPQVSEAPGSSCPYMWEHAGAPGSLTVTSDSATSPVFSTVMMKATGSPGAAYCGTAVLVILTDGWMTSTLTGSESAVAGWPVGGWPVAVEVVVRSSAGPLVVQVYLVEAPAARVPRFDLEQSGKSWSTTETLDSGTSPLLVTVSVMVSGSPCRTWVGLTVLITSIAGVDRATTAEAEAVTGTTGVPMALTGLVKVLGLLLSDAAVPVQL